MPCDSKHFQRVLSVSVECEYGEDEGAAHLFWRDGPLACLPELFDDLGVTTEILLAADENDGQVLAKVQDFRDPL